MTRTGVCSATNCIRASLFLVSHAGKPEPVELCAPCTCNARNVAASFGFEAKCELVGVLPDIARQLRPTVVVLGNMRHLVAEVCAPKEDQPN